MPNRPYATGFYSSQTWGEASEASEQETGGIAVSDPLLGQHEVEQNIWRELQMASGGDFSSLIVRRLHDGVCLQGVLETENAGFLGAMDSLVKRVACVDRVLNQLVVREPRHAPN